MAVVLAFFVLLLAPIALAPPPVGSNAEETALLLAIQAQPDEDTVRLVYADWLDEHGRPERAEFIRLQIELYRMPPNDSKYGEKRAREKKLLADPKATELPEFFRKGGPPTVRLTHAQKHPGWPGDTQIEHMIRHMEQNPFDVNIRQLLADLWGDRGNPTDYAAEEALRLILQAHPEPLSTARTKRVDELLAQLPPGEFDPSWFTIPKMRTLPIYERGFLEELVVPETTPDGDPFLHTPFLRRLSIPETGADDGISSLSYFLKSDVAKQIESMHCGAHIVRPGLQRLLQVLERATELSFTRQLLASWVTDIVRSPLAKRLTLLEADPWEANLGDELRNALAAWDPGRFKLKRISGRLHSALPATMRTTVKAISEGEGPCATVLSAFSNL